MARALHVHRFALRSDLRYRTAFLQPVSRRVFGDRWAVYSNHARPAALLISVSRSMATPRIRRTAMQYASGSRNSWRISANGNTMIRKPLDACCRRAPHGGTLKHLPEEMEAVDPLVRSILDDVVIQDDGLAYVDNYASWIKKLRNLPPRENSRVFVQLAIVARQFFDAD